MRLNSGAFAGCSRVIIFIKLKEKNKLKDA